MSTSLSTMAQLAVHSWHINIHTGDSAIHLLVDTSTAPLPTILKSVLIDGGKYTNYAETAIGRAIWYIRQQYALTNLDYDTDPTTMRFDGIVVTHW